MDNRTKAGIALWSLVVSMIVAVVVGLFGVLSSIALGYVGGVAVGIAVIWYALIQILKSIAEDEMVERFSDVIRAPNP